MDVAAEADDGRQAFFEGGFETLVNSREELILALARFGEEHFVTQERQEMTASQLVADVAEIDKIHAIFRPAGTTIDRGRRPHPGLADDRADEFFVVRPGDGGVGTLPGGTAEAEGVEQGGGAAGIASNDELIGGTCLGIGRFSQRRRSHHRAATTGEEETIS